MFRLTLALLFSTLLSLAHAQGLEGKVEGRNYVSPTGMFKVAIPVLPELGGEITDTPNVVTFQDDFNVHVSIAAFPQDATQRWQLSTQGTKDYCIYFFRDFVLADFRRAFEGVARITEDVNPGVVVATLGYWRSLNRSDGSVNSISSDAWSGLGRAPTFSDNLVEVVRVN